MKIKEKIAKASSAKEEIGLKNLSSDDVWLAKGVDQKMMVQIEVTILIPSFIDFFLKSKSYMCIVWMCDHYYIIWLSMLGDNESSRAVAEGKSVLVFWYLFGF